MGEVVAISGIRDVSEKSLATVEETMAKLQDASQLRFGGARGVDTWALRAVAELEPSASLVVIVPYCVSDQPSEAQKAIRAYADHVIELRLRPNRRAYLHRNDVLIETADRLVAFTDGRRSGGTSYTMRQAKELGIPVEVVLVEATGER